MPETALIGDLTGLKPSHRKQLKNLGRIHIPSSDVVSWDAAKRLISFSLELNRSIGLVFDRRGYNHAVVLGTATSIQFPNLDRFRVGLTRLSGFRFIFSQIQSTEISKKVITDLLTMRLDLVAGINADSQGLPNLITIAHLSRDPALTQGVDIMPSRPLLHLTLDTQSFITDFEHELLTRTKHAGDLHAQNIALICAARFPRSLFFLEDIAEIKDLCRTAGLAVVDQVVQARVKPDIKFFLGRGKLEHIQVLATQKEVDYLIFLQGLSPAQAANISDVTQLKVLDRTQLILDIFAQRANSHDGKVQVELAQLKYTLPRLREKESHLSRLVGGIGGRGPGETKISVHRRRARDRVHRLEKEIEQLALKRTAKRALRHKKGIPIVSIVGYTNAGKSTLLNTLTHSHALAENKLFATLDPFSKKLRFPREREVIITDTVGFIRDLPPDLIKAFRATLEEIGDAHALIHVVDANAKNHSEHMRVVYQLLRSMSFDDIPEILVFNKCDLLPIDTAQDLCKQHNAIGLSAIEESTCLTLLTRLEKLLWPNTIDQSVTEHLYTQHQ